MWLQIIAFRQEQSFIIIYHVLYVSEIIQRETISFKKIVDGQVTCFFFLRNFIVNLVNINIIKTLWPTVDLNTWSPSSNGFFQHDESRRSRGPGLLPRSSFNSQLSITHGSFYKKIPTDPFNIPRYPKIQIWKDFLGEFGVSVENVWLSYGLMRSHVLQALRSNLKYVLECFPPNTVHQKTLSTKWVPRSVYFDCMSFHKGQNSMPALCTDY